jgi:hypothetical protein
MSFGMRWGSFSSDSVEEFYSSAASKAASQERKTQGGGM